MLSTLLSSSNTLTPFHSNMAQVRDTIAIDNKPETSLHEDDTKGDEPILETRFASLTRWQALKTFKRVFMFCGFAVRLRCHFR